MKVTVLGANGAFSTGKHDNMISLSDLNKIIEALKDSNSNIDSITEQFVKRAYVPTWQSNFLIEFDMPGRVNKNVFRFVLDFGGDIRHSLENVGLKISDIDAWYGSHRHNDHIGGIECMGLMTFFNPFFNAEKAKWLGDSPKIATKIRKDKMPDICKPQLIAHEDVLFDIWDTAKGGLDTLQGIRDVSLDTYFDVVKLTDKTDLIYQDGAKTWKVNTVFSVHVMSGSGIMNSYGLMFERNDGKKIYFPTDSQFMSPEQLRDIYVDPDVIRIYQDCETSPFPSDVHPHIKDLKTLPAEVKQKCLLYHYQEIPTVGKHIDEGEFGAVLKMGDVQEY